jgi:anti-sigma factor RsiW
MNQRDLELLSSYLDGQLKSSDSARLESRLSTDPDLRGVLDDLRAARGLLRRLPQRKAPRNFRLTPKMVGKNPPLPRTYPAFKFVTAIATFLLFFTVGVNFLAPQLASQPPAYGMGGGGAPEILSAQEAPATEAPAVTEPLAPAAEMVPLPTTTPDAAFDSARTGEPPSLKSVVTAQDGFVRQSAGQSPASQPVPPVWQILLVGVALLSAFVMVMMRQAAANRWRRK